MVSTGLLKHRRDQIPLLDTVLWWLSPAWAARKHDCTLAGIQQRCGGRCCSAKGYWPPNAYIEDNQRAGKKDEIVQLGVGWKNDLYACGHLTKHGCELGQEHMPITCLLHPFKLNRTNTLVCSNWVTTQTGTCGGNHGQGPPMIKSVERSFVTLFGRKQYAEACNAVLTKGEAYTFIVPASVHIELLTEIHAAKLGKKPVPRNNDHDKKIARESL